MKIENRLKFNGTISGNTLTVVSAFSSDTRTLAQCIADGANDTDAIQVGDTDIPIAMTDGTNEEVAMFTVADTTHLTRTRTVSSSNGGQAVNFPGNLTAFSTAINEVYRNVPNPNDIGYDVILIIGQSNGAGRGVVDSIVDVSDPRISQWGSDNISASNPTLNKISQAVEPLSHAENIANTGVGPGMPFARAYLMTNPANRKVLLVPAAIGSTALCGSGAAWAPNAGSNNLTYAIGQAQAALAAAQAIHPKSRIVGAIWAQGEQDGNLGTAASTYQAALTALINEVRTNLSAPKMWFMIHGMNPDYISNTLTGTSQTNYQAIQTALQNVAASVDHCWFVPGPSGQAAYNNGVHYTSLAYRILGAASANLVQSAKRFVAPVVAASAVTVNSASSSTTQNTGVTFTFGTNHPLTGSQSETITPSVSGVTGTWNPTTVALNASTPTATSILTPTGTGTATITASAAGSPTLANGTATLTVNAQGTETLAINTIGSQVTGTAYSISGTWANVQPTNLNYAITDSGGSQSAFAALTNVVINSNGSWTATVPAPTTTSTSRTMVVQDTAHTSIVSPPSNAYTVSAPAAATYATWSSTDKSSNAVVSNNNLTLSGGGGTAAWQGGRATVGKSTGKWYWEVHVDASSTGVMVGVANQNAALTNYIGSDGNGFGIYGSSGALFGTGKSSTSGSAFGANHTIGLALDMTSGTLTIYLDGVLQCGGPAFTGLTGTLYPAVSPHSGAPTEQVTANFGANLSTTPFAYSPPSGYTAGLTA